VLEYEQKANKESKAHAREQFVALKLMMQQQVTENQARQAADTAKLESSLRILEEQINKKH
jgi:hypothetical protein